MCALSFSETINKLSEYRHGDRECVEDDNTIKIDCQTFAYAEYWLRYAYETGHLAETVRCKDCKYGSLWSDENVIVCDKLSKTRDKNWFCADGEKKVSE